MKGFIKYFYYFNALSKQYQLNNYFLINNIIKFFNMNFDKNECLILNRLINEINISKFNNIQYWENGYKKLLSNYNYFCNKFK